MLAPSEGTRSFSASLAANTAPMPHRMHPCRMEEIAAPFYLVRFRKLYRRAISAITERVEADLIILKSDAPLLCLPMVAAQFKAAHFEVTVASIHGGEVPFDPASLGA